MYGKTYKKIRIKQKILQKDAARDIVSVASLSHWENGKGDIPFAKFIELLKRIHLTPEEFFKLANISKPSPILKKMRKLYLARDVTGLKTLCTQQIKRYEQKRTVSNLYLMAIVCNYYHLISNENLLLPKYQLKIISFLSDTPEWIQKHISIFENCTSLLSNKKNYALSKLLLNKWSRIEPWGKMNESGSSLYNIAFQALLNSLTILILRKSYTLARKLLNQINQIKVNNDFLHIELKRTFLANLLIYSQKKDFNAWNNLKKSVEFADFLNQKDIHSEFINLIQQVNKNSKLQ